MEPFIVIVAVAALLVGGTWMQYRASGGRTWSPLWTAFSLTAAALLFLTAGFTGYELQGGIPFSRASSFTGAVVWWEVGAALGLALIALPLWRVALRRIQAS
jgi:hypothetical protein